MGAYGGTAKASKSHSLSPIPSVTPETDAREVSVYPNPFSIYTTIKYLAPSFGSVMAVLYDIQGRKIKTLLDENVQQGSHSIQWDGTNSEGQKVDCGVYFLQLKTVSGSIETRKILLK
jgi:hypothetical protein